MHKKNSPEYLFHGPIFHALASLGRKKAERNSDGARKEQKADTLLPSSTSEDSEGGVLPIDEMRRVSHVSGQQRRRLGRRVRLPGADDDEVLAEEEAGVEIRLLQPLPLETLCQVFKEVLGSLSDSIKIKTSI